MPGVSEKDVQVTLENDVLTIEGEVNTAMYEGLSPSYTEYNVGNYFRQFLIHEMVDTAGIKATMRNGELEWTCPRSRQQSLAKSR